MDATRCARPTDRHVVPCEVVLCFVMDGLPQAVSASIEDEFKAALAHCGWCGKRVFAKLRKMLAEKHGDEVVGNAGTFQVCLLLFTFRSPSQAYSWIAVMSNPSGSVVSGL